MLWTVVSLAAIGAVVAAVAWYLLASESGAQWVVREVVERLSQPVTVSHVRGTVRGPLELHGLRAETENVSVTIERLTVDWRLRDLLTRRLAIERLDASGVGVVVKPAPQDRPTPRGDLPDIDLPISVFVREAVIERLALSRIGRSDTMAADRIEVQRATVDRLLRVERLAADAPNLGVELRFTLQPRGSYPIDAEFDWWFHPTDAPKLAGQGRLGGSLDTLDVWHELSSPARTVVQGVVRNVLRDPTFDLALSVPPINAAEVDDRWPAIRINGNLRVHGTRANIVGQGTISTASERFGRIDAELALRHSDERLLLEELALVVPGAPARVVARGWIQTPVTDTSRFDLGGEWRDLRWPLVGPAIVRSPAGAARVSGITERYRLGGRAEFVRPDLVRTRVTVDGRGDRRSVRLDRAVATLLDGRVRVAGSVTWQPDVAWDLGVRADSLSVASLVPDSADWPGRLRLRGRSSGRLTAAGPTGRVELDTIAGVLREGTVLGAASVAFAHDAVSVQKLALDWGTIRVRASGHVSDTLALAVQLEAPDLGVALPRASGGLSLDARLHGPRTAPVLDASFRGGAIVVGDNKIGLMTGRADLDLSLPGTVALDLEATDVAIGTRTVDRLTLNASGTRELHNVNARTESPEVSITLQARGGALEHEWRGHLSDLTIQSAVADRWILGGPVAVSAARTRVDLGELCLVRENARGCVSGTWDRDAGTEVSAAIERLPLSLFTDLALPDWSVTGTVDGHVQARVEVDGALRGEALLQPGPGTLTYPLDDAPHVIGYDRGAVTLRADESGVYSTIDLAMTYPDGSRFATLSGEARFPEYTSLSQDLGAETFTARLAGFVDDLEPLTAAVPELSAVVGRFELDVTFDGTVAAPRVVGEARLRDAQAEVARLGLQLTDVAFTASGRGTDRIVLDGRARSGEGTVTLRGEAPLRPTATTPLRIRLSGERFQVMNTPEIQLVATPDLEVLYAGERVEVGGEISVPRAIIELSDVPQTAVPVSRDVVYVRAEDTADSRLLDVYARLRLILGDEISFKGFGITADLEGSLLAVDEPGRPTVGTGELIISRGRYKAYGQDLTVEQGRLLFGGGPVDNPGLDIRATRTAADDVVAGLLIRGTLRAPEVTLFSEPPMAQSDALAYLLLGRPLNQASASDGNRVANAATSLGVRGGNLLARRIGSRFGLQEARIETDGSLEEAAFVAGKYLSPRLYVSYGIGLFNAVSTVRMRYLLSSKWTLQAESGDATSSDLLYRIETGGSR